MENDIDLCFAILANDAFGYGLPDEDSEFNDFDVLLDTVQTNIRNFYFVDS